MIASTDRVRVALHDLGGPDGAPVLLFSHATGLHGRVWAPMASHLSDRFRCLAVDYRGHGLAETPEGTSLAWPGMADDCVAVLGSELVTAAPAVHGVGHSMGGAALVLAAVRRPEAMRSLWLYEPILPGPGARFSSDGPNPMADAAIRRRPTFDSLEAARANYASKPPLDQLDPAALAEYVEGGFAALPDGSVTLRCRPQDEAATFSMAGSSGAYDVLPTLDLPVAVVVGRDDGAGPADYGPPAVAAMPKGTLVERLHLGHFGPLEDPAGMAADLAEWVG
jgi:pimeloyl-ACP methyl ester carboxylesterase